MDCEIIRTEPAVADLEAVIRSRAEHDPEAAETLRLTLLDSVAILSRFPFIGPTYERDLDTTDVARATPRTRPAAAVDLRPCLR